MTSLSDIRNIVAAYKPSEDNPCSELLEPIVTAKRNGEGVPLEDRTVRQVTTDSFRLPTTEEFLNALRADGPLGKIVADQLEANPGKPLNARTVDGALVKKGLDDYDRMSRIFGRNTAAVTKQDLKRAFPQSVITRLINEISTRQEGAYNLKDLYDAIMGKAEAVADCEKALQDALNDNISYNGKIRAALENLADANSELANLMCDFRNDCGRFLTDGEMALVDDSLARWDDFAERIELRAHAIGDLADDLSEFHISLVKNKVDASQPSALVKKMVESLNGLEDTDTETKKITDFAAALGDCEKRMDEFSKALEEENDGKTRQERFAELKNSVGALKKKLVDDWKFSTVNETGKNGEKLQIDYRQNMRAYEGITDLHECLIALERRLASLGKIMAPKSKDSHILSACNRLFVSITQSANKLIKAGILTNNDANPNAFNFRDLASGVTEMKNGNYPTSQKRKDLSSRIDGCVAFLDDFARKNPAVNKTEIDTLRAALEDLKSFVSQLPNDDAKLLREAYEGKIDLENMIQIKMQGVKDGMILTDDLQMEGTNGKLLSSKELGNGAFNHVEGMTFIDTVSGKTVSYVMKPVAEANAGLEKSSAADYIYGGSLPKQDEKSPASRKGRPNAVANNICARKGAEALGCGHVIAKSGVTFVKGKKGMPGKYVIAMEKAPGKTLTNVKGNDRNAIEIIGRLPQDRDPTGLNRLSGKSQSLTFALSCLSEPERRKAEDQMMLLCNDLEWADFLSGQADRHGENALFSADLQLHPNAVRLTNLTLTGIDNDISFPTTGFMPLGFDATKEDLSEAFKNGVNSARMPTFVTSAMWQKLEYYDQHRNEFLADVGADLLMQEQRTQLLNRLQAMVSHARKLAAEGLVVHAGTQDDPGQTLEELSATIRQKMNDGLEMLKEKAKTIEIDDDLARKRLYRDWEKGNKHICADWTKEQKKAKMAEFSPEEVDSKKRELKSQAVNSARPLFASLVDLNPREQVPESARTQD